MSSFKDLLEQINEELEETEEFSKESLELSEHSLPLSDQVSNDILMHRDSHFGGKFEFMREYYLEEGTGALPDFDLEKINELARYEREIGQDIAPLLLTQSELEKVKCSIRMYRALQKICNLSQDVNSIPSLLADLILSEEAEPISEIKRLARNEKALPYLVDLLQTEEFYDPVFPGYGRAPLHAARCLGEMGSEKAIIPLFENMKADNFASEEKIISALKQIGEQAFNFLLEVLVKTPLTEDNEKAAIALMGFGETEAFAQAALSLLKKPEVLSQFNLAVQLLLACVGLKNENEIESFLALEKSIPSTLQIDFFYVSKQLKKKLKDA